ncbi:MULTISPECIES: molybdenum cofactor guanylyltransferase [Haloferax]|uniref:Probable molybdenum cofactor guanylyltransferase n=1 Tax=Haloferax marinum TaxID=2666143 RepID=A0A6A8GEJ9_9EURY|nr:MULTISPECIES: molybdenum cofactor guanylyltransferase [Haloferax]KAB1190686.1 molybdenum cofactor guanylyltransferase [Haloferax sp. CBA1150]MRW98216.1 NTP transferase domain-containing protein [Haloferax marinum]
MGISPAEARGVVLAGGESTRFGEQNKALAHFDGEPLISRVVATLSDATGTRPILAARSEDRAADLLEVLPPVPTVSDAPDYEGPIAGLFAAAESVSTPWIVVTGCDMPLVSQTAVRTLLEHATDGVDAVVPDDAGRPEPLLAAYRTASIRAHRSQLSRAAGPQRLLDELPSVRTLSTEAYPVLDRAVTNVNTQGELATLVDTLAVGGFPR